jgi:hypothetical protein
VIHAQIKIDTIADEPRRREARIPVEAEIPLRQLGHTSVEARLINISSLGFMAEPKEPIDPGSRIWISLPGSGRVNALVLWARNGRIGGEFAQPIDPLTVFEALGHANA